MQTNKQTTENLHSLYLSYFSFFLHFVLQMSTDTNFKLQIIVAVFLLSIKGYAWNGAFDWRVPQEDASFLGRPTTLLPLATLKGITLVTQCAFHCLQYENICISFSHNSGSYLCFLYNDTITSQTMDSDSAFSSHDISHWFINKVSATFT